MQFRKWPHYLRERKPHHLRVNGSSGMKTPLGCMALMQTTSPQGERGALGLESPLGRITPAAIQTETHLPYLHPDHDQWIHPCSKEGQPPWRNPSPTHPYLEEETPASPREKVRSGSPLLIRVLSWIKGRKISRLNGKKSARRSSPTLPPNHTQDLRLFRCELSKVA